jgi:hypothetical protein
MPGPFPGSPYPPAPPVVNGQLITVSQFVTNPARVQRAITDLTIGRYVTDVVFGQGPTATGGAVIYDQVTQADTFLADDVQEIEPGGEFPLLGDTDLGPLVAIARKYGGEVPLTDEEVRRDNRNVLNRRMVKLRNTIIRKTDTVSMAALRAAPLITQVASGDWSTAATDIISDLATATNAVDRLDLGYVCDTVLINPDQELDLLKDKDIRDALPRERDNGLIRTGNLGRLMGLDFVVSNRVLPGEVFVVMRKVIGSVSDEVPLYARPIPEPRRERTFIHGARVVTPYVTDPKAGVRITGA